MLNEGQCENPKKKKKKKKLSKQNPTLVWKRKKSHNLKKRKENLVTQLFLYIPQYPLSLLKHNFTVLIEIKI